MALTYELLAGEAVVYRSRPFDTIFALAADAFPRIKGLGGEIDMDMISRGCKPGHTYCLRGGERLAVKLTEK